jgi:hypothetical protein
MNGNLRLFEGRTKGIRLFGAGGNLIPLARDVAYHARHVGPRAVIMAEGERVGQAADRAAPRGNVARRAGRVGTTRVPPSRVGTRSSRKAG